MTDTVDKIVAEMRAESEETADGAFTIDVLRDKIASWAARIIALSVQGEAFGYKVVINPSAPAGFVLVPRQPTPEMLAAAGRIVFAHAGETWQGDGSAAEEWVMQVQAKCHAAMIAAAQGESNG